ncbi:CHAT domain-containing protein [Flavobacterium jumunjinense]|uniref:CHAT domain-containing protein n=2 Tax=Flavobacterium TaxID=237 RepID=A0ABV5GHR9_9FLAO|nr:CHAT domain-containing tetratricopeptide repeat protein [Flavobacterium jumunjinense]
MLFFLKYFYVFILFFFSLTGTSQKFLKEEMDAILAIEGNNKLNELHYLLSNQNKLLKTQELALLYVEIGKQFYKNKDNENAILFFKKAIVIQEMYKKNNLEVLNRTRNNLAWIYYYEEKNNERFKTLKQIVDDAGKDKYTFNAIIDFSILEAKRGDFYSGLHRLNIELAKNKEVEKEIKLRAILIYIYSKKYENAFTSVNQSDLNIVKQHHLKIEQKFHESNLEQNEKYDIYNNLANVYEAFNEIDVALALYEKVRKYYDDDTLNKLKAVNNIGILHAKQQKYSKANNCFQEVINKSTDIEQIATAYNNWGYFLQTNSSSSKIPYFQKAIHIILEENQTDFTIPSLDQIKKSGYEQEILVYLVDLAYHYVEAYKEEKKKHYLLKAKEIAYRVDELVSLIRYESNAEQSKLFWIEKGVNTYMLAVEVCYFLNSPEEAFYFMEKNKALLLLENIKTLQAKLALDIPKEIQDREYKLHYELLTLERLFQEQSSNKLIKQKYSSKNKEFQQFIDSVESEYPKYVKTKQKIETVTLNEVIANTISKEEVFVSYILNENHGFGIFCTSNEKLLFKLNNVIQLQSDLVLLKQLMKQRFMDKVAKADFNRISNSVFQSLFPFKDALSKLKNKKIIIVPDDALLSLPFEALLTSHSEDFSKHYLVNFSEISYLQSFSVFEKIKQKINHPQKKIMAIVPYQFENNSLPELLGSKEMMHTLERYKKSDVFEENQATKENFYNFSNEYEIIHLNTHAGIDNITRTPWIAFRNKKLTLDELYGIENEASLVILDACKTNDGVFVSGEGILSLSRGFFYNGSKSVLASIWNVNQKAGNTIIKTFYDELEQKKSKSKSLQNAKIKYLQEHKFSEALPYYWASFTLTGSTSSLEISKGITFETILIIVFIFILLVYIWSKKSNKFSKK